MKKETRKKSPTPAKSRGKVRALSSVSRVMSFSDFNRRWKPWAIAAGSIAGIATTLWGVQATFVHLRLTEAEAQLKKNFAALASESLEPVRYELTSSVRGCQTLVAAYFGAHKADRLEWAAQACISAGIETSDMYVGLAAARELTGQDAEALKILTQVAQKFDKSPDPLYRIAQIYRRNKKDDEATAMLMKAAELAPTNNQLSMEALEALSAAKHWQEARKMADRIKAVESDSIEVKLVIARALLNGGDKEGAQTLVTQARALMEKKPEIKAAVEHAFQDVLQPTASGMSPLPPGKIAEGPAMPPGDALRAPASLRGPGTPPAGSAPAHGDTGADNLHRAMPPLSPATPPRAF